LKKDLKILIACEESQTVTKLFRRAGFTAFSCDILPCSGGSEEWHYRGDVLEILDGMYKCKCGNLFEHGAGKYGCCGVSKLIEWDLMIGFPPCTDLAVSGAKHFEEKIKDGRQEMSIEFFLKLANSRIPFIAIENPVGVMSSKFRKPDQIINPYDFGDSAKKRTCLWLKNLPKLRATNLGNAPLFGESLDEGKFHITKSGKKIPSWYNLPESINRGKIRSKTFEGFARAMVSQWGEYLINRN